MERLDFFLSLCVDEKSILYVPDNYTLKEVCRCYEWLYPKYTG